VKPWLGQKNFKTLMRKLSEENPDIQVTELADKTVRIVCRARGPRGRRGRMVGVPSPLGPPPKRPERPAPRPPEPEPEEEAKAADAAPEEKSDEKPAAAETRVDASAAAD
jgi:hypothetical protein